MIDQEPTTCEKCKSLRIIRVRLDQDWAYGGDVTRVNEDSYYESGDHEDGDDRPDIEINHCEACGHQEG
jgi:hypothetical protein